MWFFTFGKARAGTQAGRGHQAPKVVIIHLFENNQVSRGLLATTGGVLQVIFMLHKKRICRIYKILCDL